jgi:hypothetical protein
MKRIILFLSQVLVVFLLGHPASLYAQANPFRNDLDLDGTNQFVSVPSGIWFSNNFTVEAWVYPRSYANWSRLLEFGNGPNSDNLLCAISSGTSGQPIFQWYNGGTLYGNLTSPVMLPTNTWTHLAFTYDAGSRTPSILMNGVVVASATGVGAPNIITRNANYVGRSLYPADAYANAMVDDLRIWNVARTPAQIKAAMGAPLTGSESGLVLYYRFDESSGTSVANSATATGATDNGTNINGALNVASTTPFFPTLAVTAATVAPPPANSGAINLNAAINPGDTPTVAYFLFGITTNYGFATSNNDLAATDAPVLIQAPVGGFGWGATVHYQLVVSNFFGVTFSPDEALVLGGLVSSLADSGPGSLRQTVAQTFPGFPIEFATNLSGQTITLTSGQLILTNNLTIDASSLPGRPTISGNGTSRLFLLSNNPTVTLNSLILAQGRVTNDSGGAIYNMPGSTVSLFNCLLTSNSAVGAVGNNAGPGGNGGTGGPAAGGAIYNHGTLALDQSLLARNSVFGGSGGSGGAFNGYAASGTGGNGGSGSGGAIYNDNGGTLTISNCAVFGNRASGGLGGSGGGGGSSDYSPAGNGANGGPAFGGAIYSLGNLVISSSTIASNTAAGGGGGNSGVTEIGNGNGGNGYNSLGGSIVSSGPITILASTIAGNSAVGGPAGLSLAGTLGFGLGQGANGQTGVGSVGGIVSSNRLTLQSSLIAGNVGSNLPDLLGTIVSAGHNLLGAADGSSGLINDLNGDMARSAAAPLNPALAPLADNGGPTPTMALLPNSPALDAGDDSLTNDLASDQRGDPRLSGRHVDIGAFEFQTAGYAAPTIVAQSADGVAIDSVTHLGGFTVSASVNPNGLVATAWIQYGPGTTYGNSTGPITIEYGSNSVPLDLPLTGLPPGIPIHYRVAAANVVGTNYGVDIAVNISLPGDFNGDGVVSSSELNAVYASYLPASPWLYLTNIAGLGGTNVTFSLNNSPAGNYTVQYSTNLSDWYNLGPVTPEYLFIDTNAPSSPQRFYRLTYP